MPGRKSITIRVFSELHHAARVKTVTEGTTIAEVLVAALRAYVEGTPCRAAIQQAASPATRQPASPGVQRAESPAIQQPVLQAVQRAVRAAVQTTVLPAVKKPPRPEIERPGPQTQVEVRTDQPVEEATPPAQARPTEEPAELPPHLVPS